MHCTHNPSPKHQTLSLACAVKTQESECCWKGEIANFLVCPCLSKVVRSPCLPGDAKHIAVLGQSKAALRLR